jgi:hypothetical protein
LVNENEPRLGEAPATLVEFDGEGRLTWLN